MCWGRVLGPSGKENAVSVVGAQLEWAESSRGTWEPGHNEGTWFPSHESLWLSGLSPNSAGGWKFAFYLELKRHSRSVFIIM